MNIKHSVKKVAENIHDRIDETAHRTVAEGENARRKVAGDKMTRSEKVKSMVNQAKHEIKANVDKAKRTIRENS